MIRAAATALAVLACGCSLLPRGHALAVSYFSPEAPGETAPQARPARDLPLRLGRVRGAPRLHERIAYRKSEYELGFYDDKEWTERPEYYVRLALERRLFDEGPFEQAKGLEAPTLDVQLLAFEERRTPPAPSAYIAVRYALQQGDLVLDGQTVTVALVARGGRFEDFVAAMSEALDRMAERIADGVARQYPSR